MKQRAPLTVEVLRGSAVESKHQVMAVVVDERGVTKGHCGNSEYLTYPRSSIKALQAIPFVESEAIEKFSLDEKKIALACASHRGEKLHLAVLTEWLKKLNATENQLACGPVYPADQEHAHELIRAGQGPSRIYHNCSGKHLGIISGCLAIGDKFEDYQKPLHPGQIRIRKVLSECFKISLDKMPIGIDGCGIPTFAVPLRALALGMSVFLNQSEVGATRRVVLQRILTAWRHNPVYVSGTDEIGAVLAEKTKGRALLKTGAEGAYCGLLPEQGLAFSLKTADGSERAADFASAYLFHKYGAIDDAEFEKLKEWTRPIIKNSRGEDVGSIRMSSEGT